MCLSEEYLDENTFTGYNEANGGDDMKARDVIQAALNELGVKQESLAEKLGLTPQNLSRKLMRDTIRTREFFDAIDALGLQLTVSRKDTGEVIRELRRGVLPQVSMVVNQVRYDTFKSDALCHTEMLDGWMMELYRDHRGRHFLVHWTDWPDVKPSISPCGKEQALRLYEVHRDASDPEPHTMFE